MCEKPHIGAMCEKPHIGACPALRMPQRHPVFVVDLGNVTFLLKKPNAYIRRIISENLIGALDNCPAWDLAH